MGNTTGESIYGTNQVAKGIQGGVDLVNATTKGGFSGPLRDGATGYAYASPSGSLTDLGGNVGVATGNASYTSFTLDGAVSDANLKRIKYDPDLLSITDSSRSVIVCDIKKANITSAAGDPDFENLSPFVLVKTNLNAGGAGGAFADALANVTDVVQIRRLSSLVAAADAMTSAESIRIVYTVAAASYTADQAVAAIDNTITNTDMTFPVRDQYDAAASLGGVVGDLFDLENNADIPEIDIKVDSCRNHSANQEVEGQVDPRIGTRLECLPQLGC